MVHTKDEIFDILERIATALETIAKAVAYDPETKMLSIQEEMHNANATMKTWREIYERTRGTWQEIYEKRGDK